MMWAVVVISSAVVVVLAVALGTWSTRRRLKPFLRRGCANARWRVEFPQASSEEVRAFLRLFVDAFALPRSAALSFEPRDRIMDVYRAMNPAWIGADSMELECLAMLVEQSYQRTLEAVWREDLTLGELFAHLRKPVAPRPLPRDDR